MKSSNNRNLNDHIKEILLDHQEPYVLGSWERFQRQSALRKKEQLRKTVFRAAAAILIICTFAYSWFGLSPGSDEQLADGLYSETETILPFFPNGTATPTQQEPEEQYVSGDKSEPDPYRPDQTTVSSDSEIEPSAPLFSTDFVSRAASRVTPYTLTVSYLQKTDTGLMASRRAAVSPFGDRLQTVYEYEYPLHRGTIPEVQIPPVASARSPIGHHSGYQNDRPARQGRSDVNIEAPLSGSQAKDEFTFSIAYASVLNMHSSKSDFGVGGGIYADWNFSERFSLNSGLFVAQNQLSYDMEHGSLMQTFEDSGENTLAATGDLNNIRVDLVSLEVPLSIRYSLNDRFSFSAGLSSVTWLKEQYDYNFEYEQTILVLNTQNGGLEHRTELVTFSETVQQSEPSMNGMEWGAFYTFSLGYEQEIAGRQTVSFEPFLKIPTGRLTSRGIKYTTGGLQLKLFF